MKANTENKTMWKSREHVVWRIKGDLLVVLNTESGHYYTLNEVAVDLWRGLFDEKKGFEEVISNIRSRYANVPDDLTIEADCRESLAYWVTEKLIEETAG
jgi:hypothetical protein